MNYHNKLILSDCDGVLSDWEWAFHIWMQERGYTLKADAKHHYLVHHMFNDIDDMYEARRLIKTFNESAAVGFIPALRDAVYYVKLLHERHGYQFRVITSLSKDINAQKLRDMNLRKIFGNAIEQIIFLDTGADKDDVLEPYRDSGLFWVEDKFENFKVGVDIGLRSILMEHGHNFTKDCAGGYKVKDWKGIYEYITGSEND